jgi:tetratricopeptide (TPR) repeat protein
MTLAYLFSVVTLSLASVLRPDVDPNQPGRPGDAALQARQRATPSAAQPADATRLALDGNTALKERRYAEALEAFTAAARLVPLDPNLHFLSGYSAYMLGQFAAARPSLERALSLNPRLTDASTVLGIVLYRLGKVADAVTVLEAGQNYAPDSKDIADLLAKWRPEATSQSNLFEARGAHFSVLFQGPADDLVARRIVDLLEDAYWRICATLSTYPTEPVTVVLYTTEQFRAAANAPDWAGAMYDGRIKIPTVGALQNPAELKSTLAHEFTHAVVAQLAGGAAPKWLNEGLAELLQSNDLTRIEQLLARSPRRLPHAQLERDFSGLSSSDVALAYAQSAVAVRRMMDLRGAAAVVALLQALGRGTRFDQAFQSTIAMRYEDFVSMLARY